MNEEATVNLDVPDVTQMDKDALPPEKAKDPILKKTNFADNEETCKAFLAKAQEYLRTFKGQSARTSMEDMMDDADRYFRMAEDQDKASTDKTPNVIDAIPHIFKAALEMFTANQCDILFPRNKHVGRYKPLESLDKVSWEETKPLTDAQTLIFEYSNMVDNRVDKLKNFKMRVNKYQNGVCMLEWYVREYMEMERKTDETGKIERKYVKRRVEHPRFVAFDLSDVYFDSTIEDEDEESGPFTNHQCILLNIPFDLNDLVAEQKNGQYVNISQLSGKQQYFGQQHTDVKTNRSDNAGDGSNTGISTGLFDVWHIFMKAPIDKDGKWDETATIPTWHKMTVAGNIDKLGYAGQEGKDAPGGLVPLCLIANPYEGGGGIPLFLDHSHRDDKGAYHTGFVDACRSKYEELRTALNQWFFDKDSRNNAPFVQEQGAMITEDKEFTGPTKLLTVNTGYLDKIKRLTWQSNTQDISSFIMYLETAIIQDIFGMTKSFRGVEMGSRTSAIEARTAFDQSRKPFMDKIHYSSRLLKWLAYWDARMWRQFASPETVISLTRETQLEEIKPADVYGAFRFQVESVDEYEDTMVQRNEDDRFQQITLPILAQVGGKKAVISALRHLYAKRNYPINEILPETTEFDAIHVARSENIGFTSGIWDEPKPEENHDVHLSQHEGYSAIYSTLPAEQQNPKVKQYLAAHIEIHKQLQQSESAQLAQSMQAGMPPTGLGTGMTPPQGAGQVAQDELGAEGGASA